MQVGDRVVLDVQRLVISPGERVAIVGPNGAGKSTLLRLVAGLAEARDGEVQVLGRCLSTGPSPCAAPAGLSSRERRSLRRETGLLMQGLHLVSRLTARENVLVGALGTLRGMEAMRSLLRWYPASTVQAADAALAALGLSGLADVRVDRLSGGERQKVAVARLQLQRPRLVLADEPTSALDPAATRQVCAALVASVAEAGQSLVVVVHDLDLLQRLATRVVGMAAGRIQWDLPLHAATPERLHALYGGEAGLVVDAPSRVPLPAAALARA